MKNWGLRILIIYLGFVALIATLVTMSMRQKVDLVSKDYYQKELEYQQRINSLNRTAALDSKLQWQQKDDHLLLTFPRGQKSISGVIAFFRPSDAMEDRQVHISPDANGQQVVPLSMLSHGQYSMQVSWKSGGESFYQEETINVR